MLAMTAWLINAIGTPCHIHLKEDIIVDENKITNRMVYLPSDLYTPFCNHLLNLWIMQKQSNHTIRIGDLICDKPHKKPAV